MRLRKKKQYQCVAKSPTKWAGEWIIITLRPAQDSLSKLGIVVTKRFGSSPQRNRFKRIVREAFRLTSPQFLAPFEIVIRPRSKAIKASMHHVQHELKTFVQTLP